MRRPLHRNLGYDVAVVGGGIAGLTAALHAVGRGLSTVLIEAGPVYGGQVATVASVEGLPMTRPTSGVDLSTAMAEAVREGARMMQEPVREVTWLGAGFELACGDEKVRARRLVLATGRRRRCLGVPGEKTLLGRGVSHCATCDGPFFRGSDVAVVGGGDAALQEALTLASFCRTVFIVARGKLRARAAYVDRAVKTANIRFVWDCVVDAVLGDDTVRGVRLRNACSGVTVELACAGVFAYLGGIPNSGIAPAFAARDGEGCLTTDGALQTSVPGLFAIGAVRAGYCGDLAAAVGDAATAIRAIAR